MIQVKENLLINSDKLNKPSVGNTSSLVVFDDGKIYFKDLESFITHLTTGGRFEDLSEDIDPNAIYYVGVYGKSDKPLKIYKGDGYKETKIAGDFMYIEIKGEKIEGPIHVLSDNYASGYIYALGIYKDSFSEVYMPNKSNVKPRNQAIFPIGGGTRKCSLYSPRLEDGVC